MMISGIEKWDRVTWWGSTRTYSATGEWKRVIVNGPDGCESNEGQQTCAWQTHPYPHPATLTATLTATCTATHTLPPRFAPSMYDPYTSTHTIITVTVKKCHHSPPDLPPLCMTHIPALIPSLQYMSKSVTTHPHICHLYV